MKKIIVFSPFYPPHTGGLESHAAEFNEYLSPFVDKIIVFTPKLPKNAPERKTVEKNIEIIRFPAFEIIPNYPIPKFWKSTFWKLYSSLFKERPSLVISRTRFFLTSLLALFFAKKIKIKHIHIEHGSDFVKLNNHFFSFLAEIYDYTLGKLVLNCSDQNIANSKASAKFCKKLAPKKSCEVIYRGIRIEEIKKFKPNHKLKRKYANRIIITFLGRLIDGKGVQDLIKALKNIEKNYVLFAIGDGSFKKPLKKLINEYEMSNKVIFFGQKNAREAIRILKISDIFVNPSYTEGLPTSVIEAALCEKAIIATNVGGTPEIIKDKNGIILIKPKDVNSLRENLLDLMGNKNKRLKMGELAYQDVRKRFSWKNSIKKYLQIFKL